VCRAWEFEDTVEDRVEDDRVEDLEILTENEFSERFSGNKSGKFWKKLRYIQTCVKSKTGVGHPIIIQFYAPDAKPKEQIKYDYRSQGEDITLIKSHDDYKYCYKQCLKMCYYIQKIHDVEILKMRCEFTKDDHGTIWFTYASQIHSKEIRDANAANVKIKMVRYINKEHQVMLKE
jgi:hypothetical protein